MASTRASEKQLTGRHVLAMLVAFFGLVFAANAYMIRMALATHSGVVANEPYKVGLKYNDRLSLAEEQTKLGWQEEITLSSSGDALDVTMHDAGGGAVLGLTVTALLGRPATTAVDERLELRETTPGRYEAATSLKDPGSYIVTIEARNPVDGAMSYRARKRLWLKP